MFGIFTSEQKRARHDAQNWLHLAGKVYHFRRDLLSAQEIQALQLAVLELRTRLKERADAAKLKMGMQVLEGCLRRSGGAYYPKSSMVDNVEFFLVALILFLGIRAFIVQPFKIPTNSMWPTYNGLTAEAYVEPDRAAADAQEREFGTIAFAPADAEPGLPGRVFRWVLFGASPRRVDAPIDGEVFVPYLPGYGFGSPMELVGARKWLVLPDEVKRYPLYVGNQLVSFTAPADFRYDLLAGSVFFDDSQFFRQSDRLNEAIKDAVAKGRTADVTVTMVGRDGRRQSQQTRALLLSTGRRVRKGERVLSFDVMTGDQLFVDRVSYHFVPPKVGDGFVFRTLHIRNIEQGREYSDKYYIKRLVGLPGDTLEVREPALYRNGAPITGAAAFAKHVTGEDNFPPYTAIERLAPGQIVTVPKDGFFAMGDNSPDSADSRYWGFVPADDVVGRPLWVYFPFSRRWGPAR